MGEETTNPSAEFILYVGNIQVERGREGTLQPPAYGCITPGMIFDTTELPPE